LDTSTIDSGVKLAELCERREDGMMVVGEGRDGQPVHISAVPRGRDCDCVCPGCGRDLIAKKGAVMEHFFAHVADTSAGICTSAGETALHKFAKRVLEAAGEIALPRTVVKGPYGEIEAVVEGIVRFDRVELEKRDGEVVPDVVCHFRGKRLFVEFAVTHPCDEEKLAKLRKMDVSVLEIDLSAYRGHDLAELERDRTIIEAAPRVMLQSPRIDAAQATLDEMERKANARHRSAVERLRRLYLERPAPGPNKSWRKLEERGLADLAEPGEFDGTPFTVVEARWKAAVIIMLTAEDASEGRTPKSLAAEFRKQGWLKPEIDKVDDETARFASQQMSLTLDRPHEAIGRFLDGLEKMQEVRRHLDWTFMPWGRMRAFIIARRSRKRTIENRQEEAAKTLRMIFGHLDKRAREEFDEEAWYTWLAAEYGTAITDLFDPTSTIWQEFIGRLLKLTQALSVYPPRMPSDLMGLPLDRLFVDKIEKFEVSSRERAAAAAERRGKEVADDAARMIGEEAQDWISLPVADHHGLTPVEIAIASDEGYGEMRRRLAKRRDERDADRERRMAEAAEQRQVAARERQEQAVIDNAREELMREAESLLASQQHADVWLRSGHPALQGRRPLEYCVDQRTLGEVRALLPPGKRRSR
jgi:hypothetical protein